MATHQLASLGIYFAVNTVAFFVMGWDKYSSRQTGADRISEGLMFFMAAALGSVGVFVGMFVFRHKTRTWYFLIGIPLIILQNIALITVLLDWFEVIPWLSF